jgi:hypothetical protein
MKIMEPGNGKPETGESNAKKLLKNSTQKFKKR